jgi:hypothetical protein
MQKQFLHEDHNRQDKAKKPDYRPEMIERGRSEPTPTDSSRLVARASARENLLQTIRKHRFVYQRLSFKFGWNLEVFARKNSLPIDDALTKEAMETVRRAAERDVELFAARIKVAPMRKQGIFYHFDYEVPQTQCQMLRK